MKKNIAYYVSVWMLALIPLFAMAQPATPGGGTGSPSSGGTSGTGSQVIPPVQNPLKGANDLMSFIRAILNNIIMPIAAVGVVFWIIWSGFQYLLAQGNPTKIKAANTQLLWSLIGAGILLGAAGISAVVERTVRELVK